MWGGEGGGGGCLSRGPARETLLSACGAGTKPGAPSGFAGPARRWLGGGGGQFRPSPARGVLGSARVSLAGR